MSEIIGSSKIWNTDKFRKFIPVFQKYENWKFSKIQSAYGRAVIWCKLCPNDHVDMEMDAQWSNEQI